MVCFVYSFHASFVHVLGDERHLGLAVRRPVGPVHVRLLPLLLVLLDHAVEVLEAVRRGAKVRQGAVAVDDPVEGALHGAQRAEEHEHPAQGDLALEVARGQDEVGEGGRGLHVEGGEEGQALRVDHHQPPDLHDLVELVLHATRLAVLGAVEGDALGVVPDLHDLVPEVGLVLLLGEVDEDQLVADEVGLRLLLLLLLLLLQLLLL